VAKESPVKGVAQVLSADDAKKALQNGYPIAICSQQGFSSQRDQDGFCKAQGSWAHCMACVGYQDAPRKGFFILNSWGDRYHKGPSGKGNPSPAGFWAEYAAVDRMIRAGDTWAFADLKGFPRRKLDWFAHPRPVGKRLTHPKKWLEVKAWELN
jgi:C1A family cysteine protease